MKISTVNELIQSLESAGELSIKETNVMALAKAYQQLAAENVALKAGRKFFMYSDDSGFETFETQEEAIKAAHEMIDACREDAYDGWPEEADTIRWGVVIQQATETDFEKPAPENGWEGSSDYKLLPELPATDRIVDGIKADGVEEWVSSRGGRWNGTTEEALKFAKQLREGAK
ncbi:hypothetical protein PTQ46_09640 [Klebsiella michiganensis]|uniref:hypothetical protein n=1 Tax=Klebsiella michiganensis TaxID=1134687 RepID=UPI001CCC18B4|nr:hypothetical protein [Klebsiella michiganensis]MBZ7208096.1 hypothetical protein [Klebsiella michiganensis]MDS7840475.1 hypothetical protein [Klebsiella michiganensis]